MIIKTALTVVFLDSGLKRQPVRLATGCELLGSRSLTAVAFTMHTIAMPMSIFCMYCIPTPAKMINAKRKRIENKSDGPIFKSSFSKFRILDNQSDAFR